jgi:hypothetical protein
MVRVFQPQENYPAQPRNSQQPNGYTVKQPELTSLIGLCDSDGDQLHLVRLDRTDGSRAYLMAIGQERVSLTSGDLDRLSTVIRYEVGDGNDDLMAEFRRFFAGAIWLLILCALVWLLTFAVTPLWVYPWSN